MSPPFVDLRVGGKVNVLFPKRETYQESHVFIRMECKSYLTLKEEMAKASTTNVAAVPSNFNCLKIQFTYRTDPPLWHDVTKSHRLSYSDKTFIRACELFKIGKVTRIIWEGSATGPPLSSGKHPHSVLKLGKFVSQEIGPG